MAVASTSASAATINGTILDLLEGILYKMSSHNGPEPVGNRALDILWGSLSAILASGSTFLVAVATTSASAATINVTILSLLEGILYKMSSHNGPEPVWNRALDNLGGSLGTILASGSTFLVAVLTTSATAATINDTILDLL